MKSPQHLSLSFLGGASEIGASCTLLQVAGTNLLIDCGVRFRDGDALPDLASLGDIRPDAILVTHAHSDHTGGLPVVADTFPGTPVYATPPTIDLAMILTRDALKLMGTPEFDGDIPLFSQAQADRLQDSLRPVHFAAPFTIGEVTITFHPASHILGAAMIHLATPAGGILFTGDYCVGAQNTVPALPRPAVFADIVVSESTYGNRLHENRATAEERLLEQIREVLDGGGRVLIPAFAIGRAQEILLILKRGFRRGKLPEVPVFVDGMVRTVCDVYGRHQRYVSRSLAHSIRHDDHPFYTNGIQAVRNPEDRRRVLESGACVIVASSGMLVGGASVAYAAALVGNQKDAILITGYQDEESPGRALLDLARVEGPRMIRLGERSIDVRCRFDTYGLSAHADRMQMIGLLESLRPWTVVLVHGDRPSRESLGGGLSSRDVILAENGMEITRSYRRRGARPQIEDAGRMASRRRDIDISAARNLLGPPGKIPLRSHEVTQAWFGERVGRELIDEFIGRLESLGLVRRDDEKPSLLWVLGPSECDLFPEEAAIAEQMKQENPKGLLLELCMRLRIDPPEITCETSGAFHVVRMTVDTGDQHLDSGPQRAASKKTAEQLAAKAVLDEYRLLLKATDEVTWIKESEGEKLKAENFKGRLLEWSAARRTPTPPVFERRVIPEGFLIRARMRLPGGQNAASGWFGASAEKTAEHAAARSLLEVLSRHPNTEIPAGVTVQADSSYEGATRPERSGVDAVNSGQASSDPRKLLNELRQAGVISDFGYTLHEQRGPSHMPIFVMTGWAILREDERIETHRVEAGSKKSAQREAAGTLIARLNRIGFLADPRADSRD